MPNKWQYINKMILIYIRFHVSIFLMRHCLMWYRLMRHCWYDNQVNRGMQSLSCLNKLHIPYMYILGLYKHTSTETDCRIVLLRVTGSLVNIIRDGSSAMLVVGWSVVWVNINIISLWRGRVATVTQSNGLTDARGTARWGIGVAVNVSNMRGTIIRIAGSGNYQH